MENQQKEPIWTKSFIIVSLSNFLLFLTFYALLTSLPIYVISDLKGSETDAGLVVTIFLLSAIVVRPFSGKLLEDYGKKKMLLLSMLLFTNATVGYIWTTNFVLLLALRFFHGIWFSIATTAAGAIAADITPTTRRGEGLGYFALSNNIAIVVGPFIALTLVQVVTFLTLYIVLTVCMVAAILLTLVIKVPAISSTSTSTKRRLTFNDLFEKNAIPIALTACLVAFSYSSILSFLSIYAQSLGLIESASYFFLVFAAVMLISRPFVGRLFDSMGPNIVIYPAMFSFALGLFLLSMTNSPFMLLLSAAFIGLGYGTIVPCFQTLAVQSAERKRSAHATATFFTLFDIGVATGSYVLGVIVTYFGYEQLYLLASGFIILILLAYRQVSRQRSKLETNVGVKEMIAEK